MSRDPFDQMRNRNPVPSEDQPPAPMSVAARIMGRSERAARRSLPGFAMAAIAATAVVVAGGALLLLTRPPADPGFASGDTTTTTPPDSIVTTTGAVQQMDAVVYFLADQDGDGWSGGPYLIPVSVPVSVALSADAASYPQERAMAALQRLLEGVADASGGGLSLSSAIPSDTRFMGAEWAEGSAVIGVVLSEGFLSGGGSFSMQARLAQVVYTLTAIDGIDGVQFHQEDDLGNLSPPITVFGGEGIIVSDPAVREDFDTLLPAIIIESPAHLGAAGNPLVASGTANVYEATVSLSLRDEAGTLLWEGFTTATCGTGCRGDWSVEIPYVVAREQWGALTAWEASAEDGRATNVRQHRVRLVADLDRPIVECSGADASTPLADQADLPQAVAEMRAAVWQAAVDCGWAALDALVGEDFSFSFAFDSDPTAYWADREAVDTPMLFLAELLTRPYGTIDGPDGTYYVWPAAFAYDDWASVPQADRDALRPMYDDADFADFEAFGSYIGYRIGIAADGTWRFFIAGD